MFYVLFLFCYTVRTVLRYRFHSGKCSTPLACQRGGYTDPRKCDRCRCPDGFTGKLCEKTMPGYGAENNIFSSGKIKKLLLNCRRKLWW